MYRMAFERKREYHVEVPLSPEERARLKRHTERLHWTQTAMIQTAIHARLNELDEQELFAKQAKAASRRVGIAVGNVPTVNGEDYDPARSAFALPELPGGLKSIAKVAEEKLPARFEGSIGGWSRLIEQGEGAADRAIRIQMVRDDLKTRGATDAQLEATMLRVHEEIAIREACAAKKAVRAPEGIPISGDVD